MSDEPVDAMERDGARVPDVDDLRRNWGWLMALGVVWIALGTLAILVPGPATLALELLLGALFAVGGVAQIAQAFTCRRWRGALWHMLGGALALLLGGLLLFFPFEGALTLTLFVSAFFLVDGAIKIVTALGNRALPNWGWMLASGVLGILVGVLIWLGWPSSAVWVLGLLVGIQLVFGGFAMIMVALSARRA